MVSSNVFFFEEKRFEVDSSKLITVGLTWNHGHAPAILPDQAVMRDMSTQFHIELITSRECLLQEHGFTKRLEPVSKQRQQHTGDVECPTDEPFDLASCHVTVGHLVERTMPSESRVTETTPELVWVFYTEPVERAVTVQTVNVAELCQSRRNPPALNTRSRILNTRAGRYKYGSKSLCEKTRSLNSIVSWQTGHRHTSDLIFPCIILRLDLQLFFTAAWARLLQLIPHQYEVYTGLNTGLPIGSAKRIHMHQCCQQNNNIIVLTLLNKQLLMSANLWFSLKDIASIAAILLVSSDALWLIWTQCLANASVCRMGVC